MSLFRNLLIEKKRKSYYCEVEYLESNNGYQYINTGYTGNSATRVIIGASSSLTSSNIPLFGARDTNGYYNSFSIWQNTGNNGIRFDYTDTTANVVYSKTWLTTGINIIEKNGRDNYVNGVQVSSNTEKTFSCNSPFYLMSINTSGIAMNGFVGSISFCKIFDNGTLVRDFIPVLDFSLTPCMYDKVTRKLFYNQGTGSFSYGREIHYVDWLENTGAQYIDTGIQPTDEYGYRIRNTYTRGGGEQCAIGCMDSGNRFVGVYTSGAENQLSGAWGSFVGFLPTYPWATGDILDVEVNYKNSRKMIVSGTELKDISDVQISGTISNTIYIGARHYGSNVTKMQGKIYGVEITKGPEVIANYIPAIDENGVSFMFDRVSHTIYDNIGTGAFGYPAREVEYLESTETQWIDTGISMENISKIECIVDWTNHHTTRRDIAGGGTSGSYSFEVSDSGYYGLGYNNWSNVQPQPKDKLTWTWGGQNTYPKLYINDSLVCTDTLLRTPSGTFKTAISSSYVPYCKFYSIKIYNFDNILIRNFIPVSLDGEAGMWDKVTNAFFSNAGTGLFVAGKILESKWF